MLESVLNEFGLNQEAVQVNALRQGLINDTWRVCNSQGSFVVQKLNHNVFMQPQIIDENINAIAAYLAEHAPEYTFVKPISSIHKKTLVQLNGEAFYRAFPFVKDSRSLAVVETPEQAYEAAKQFGRFTCNLSGIDLSKLKETIPNFHDLGLRYKQFNTAIENGNEKRLQQAAPVIEELRGWSWITEVYSNLIQHPGCKLRVMHHDTKISNVLFNSNFEGLCVIDLDTVMPGYFFSDVGDMMRTYLSPVSEEERNLEKIEIREDFFKAVVNGYQSEMRSELTEVETEHFVAAGAIMIYMQAIRFITDFINYNIYYGESYTDQNLKRALNQTRLLKCLIEKQKVLEKIISDSFN